MNGKHRRNVLQGRILVGVRQQEGNQTRVVVVAMDDAGATLEAEHPIEHGHLEGRKTLGIVRGIYAGRKAHTRNVHQQNAKAEPVVLHLRDGEARAHGLDRCGALEHLFQLGPFHKGVAVVGHDHRTGVSECGLVLGQGTDHIGQAANFGHRVAFGADVKDVQGCGSHRQNSWHCGRQFDA